MFDNLKPFDQRVRYIGKGFLYQWNTGSWSFSTREWLHEDVERPRWDHQHLSAVPVQYWVQVDWLSDHWHHHPPANCLCESWQWFSHHLGHSPIPGMYSTYEFDGPLRYHVFDCLLSASLLGERWLVRFVTCCGIIPQFEKHLPRFPALSPQHHSTWPGNHLQSSS